MFWNRIANATQKATLDSNMEMLQRFFSPATRPVRASGYPAFNVWADDDGAVVTSEIPGVDLADVDISVAGKTVTVKGKKAETEVPEGARRIRRERASGSFERNFQLGFAIDATAVRATLSDGVLEITLPRAANDKPRKITVAAG